VRRGLLRDQDRTRPWFSRLRHARKPTTAAAVSQGRFLYGENFFCAHPRWIRFGRGEHLHPATQSSVVPSGNFQIQASGTTCSLTGGNSASASFRIGISGSCALGHFGPVSRGGQRGLPGRAIRGLLNRIGCHFPNDKPATGRPALVGTLSGWEKTR